MWLIEAPGMPSRIRKTWPISPWTLMKYCVGRSQPQRQVRGAKRVRRAGLKTPDIVQPLRIEFTKGRLSLELAYVNGESALDLLRKGSLDASSMRACAAGIGAIVPKIAAAGYFNRDLKLSNLIAQRDSNAWIIWLIDPVGVRLGRRRLEEVTRMLHRLASEPLVMNIPIPRAAATIVLLSALRPLKPADRTEVLRRLRQHRPH